VFTSIVLVVFTGNGTLVIIFGMRGFEIFSKYSSLLDENNAFTEGAVLFL